jgi:hypothetical protein
LIEGKYVLDTDESVFSEDIEGLKNMTDYLDKPLQAYSTNDSHRNTFGPANKKKSVVMYTIKKKLDQNYRGNDPQEKFFKQRAIQRNEKQLNLRPNRYLDQDKLSSFVSFR